MTSRLVRCEGRGPCMMDISFPQIIVGDVLRSTRGRISF